ncbi:hypothetical protein GGI21_005130 [Coemansia aciculifera]|nr:hypothetical protein GGI21_005130 [Coemansia aciculifera]
MRSGFYETSAKKKINVDEMFIQSVRRIKFYGKQARTSGTGSSTSQESNGSAQSSRRDTIKFEAAKPKTNSGSSTKSWLPARKSTLPPPPPVTFVDNTSDIIDSYYATAEDYCAPCSPTKRRNTAAVAPSDNKRRNTRGVSLMPEQRRGTRMSSHPAKRNTNDSSPTGMDDEKPVIRLVGYGTDIKQFQKSANVNKALPIPKRRKQWQAHACPIL